MDDKLKALNSACYATKNLPFNCRETEIHNTK